jgi:polyisoprenoid-binding protein YceI
MISELTLFWEYVRNIYLVAFVAYLIIAPLAEASPQIQVLDTAASFVNFTISSPIFSGSGSFRSYSGELKLDEGGKPQAVSVKLDVSKSSVTPSGPNQLLPLPAILQALPNPVFTFVSSSITRSKNGSYKVVGTLSRGSQRWSKTFSAKLENPTKGVSQFQLRSAGEFSDPGINLPININGMENSGTIQAKLVFSNHR